MDSFCCTNFVVWSNTVIKNFFRIKLKRCNGNANDKMFPCFQSGEVDKQGGVFVRIKKVWIPLKESSETFLCCPVLVSGETDRRAFCLSSFSPRSGVCLQSLICLCRASHSTTSSYRKAKNVFHPYVSFFSQQIVNNIPMDVCNIIKAEKLHLCRLSLFKVVIVFTETSLLHYILF